MGKKTKHILSISDVHVFLSDLSQYVRSRGYGCCKLQSSYGTVVPLTLTLSFHGKQAHARVLTMKIIQVICITVNI